MWQVKRCHMYKCQFIDKFHFRNASLFYRNSNTWGEARGLAQKISPDFGVSSRIICRMYYCSNLAGQNSNNCDWLRQLWTLQQLWSYQGRCRPHVKNMVEVKNAEEKSSFNHISILTNLNFLLTKFAQLWLQLRHLWLTRLQHLWLQLRQLWFFCNNCDWCCNNCDWLRQLWTLQQLWSYQGRCRPHDKPTVQVWSVAEVFCLHEQSIDTLQWWHPVLSKFGRLKILVYERREPWVNHTFLILHINSGCRVYYFAAVFPLFFPDHLYRYMCGFLPMIWYGWSKHSRCMINVLIFGQLLLLSQVLNLGQV